MVNLPTVVILAAGENSRFFPLNKNTHKGALTLMGKPLIVHTLESLQDEGFNEVVIVVSPKDYGGNGLSAFLSNYQTNLSIQFVLQAEPLGMGDALLCARERLNKSFAVIFPSSLDAGEELIGLIDQSGNGGSMLVSPTTEPWLYGIVTLSGKRVSGIIEKPEIGTEPSNLKAQGIYYLTHEFLAFLEQTPREEYNFELALDRFMQVFEMIAVEKENPLPSLKYPWHLFEFQNLLLSRISTAISPNAKVAETAVLDTSNGPIFIDDGARIGHCVKIVGPAYIGKNVFIGDFSLIRNSSFEDGATVGVHSDVTRSILMEKASMHNGFIGDSIIGRNVKIGAGLITSNKRMDRKPIEVIVKGQRIVSGLTSFGTVIGDNASIGVRVNIMPGKFIGCRARIYPTLTIWEHVAHDTTVKQKMEIQTSSNE